MKRYLFIMVAGLLAIASSAMAQEEMVIEGTVTDNTGEPLIGVSVTVKGVAGLGTITNVDGNYTVKVQQYQTLVYSYIGFEKQEYLVKDNKRHDVTLIEEESNKMDEVVVTGMGTMRKLTVTGAVSTVDVGDMKHYSSSNLTNALAGNAPGVLAMQTSGQPGKNRSEFWIRGISTFGASSSAYILVDGFERENIDDLNIEDIESFSVLKDASATAIYGSKGANGVILITTKKGNHGSHQPQITYDYSIGLSTAAKRLQLLTASEWVQYQKDYFSNKGGYSDEQIAALGRGTDWQDAVLRTATQQEHQLSVNGCTFAPQSHEMNGHYSFSASYTDQDGIVLNSGFQRYNFHTNVEWTLRKGLRLGVTATYGRSRQQGLTTTEEQVYNSSPYSAGITNSFVYALLMPPVVPVYNADGTYNFSNPYEYAYFAIGNHTSNPVYDLRESVAENINNYLLSNVWVSYNLGDFTLKAAVGLDSEKLTQNYFSGAYTSLGMATEGIGGNGNRQTDIWQQEYTATFDKDLNASNHLDALVGYTYQHTESTYSIIMTNHFTNESLKQYNLGDGANIYTPETGISESRLHSIIGRLNYSLLDRYNLTATFRADRSSRFSAGHEWGQFPSLGLSWNVDKEPFFANVQRIDYLKVRASVGLVGNQEIPDAAYLGTYSTGSYAGSSSYSSGNASNDNLKWESTLNYNVGFDLGLLHNRVNIVADAYYKKTYDLLFVVPLGISSTVSTQLQNVGNVVNKGFELSIDGSIIKRRRVQWTAAANIAHNLNELTDMGSSKDLIYGSDNQQILSKGEPVGTFYGLEFDGIVQSNEDVTQLPKVNGNVPSPGDVKYVDHNGDGKIDGYDRTFLGSTQPKLTYGLSTQFTWRNFDVSVAFAGSVGNRVYNALGRRLEQTGDSYNVLSTVLGSWTAENGGNTLPLASTTRPFSYIDSRYVQDASYLKLRNVSVGYRVPLPKDGFIRGLKVSISAANVLTITNYKGYDPEVASGTDDGVYPASRSVSFGVNVSL